MKKIHPLQEYLNEQKKVSLIEKLRNRFYANSPFDLASVNDDKYRDAIDETFEEAFKTVEVGEHNPDIN